MVSKVIPSAQAEEIRGCLPSAYADMPIYIYEVIDSTNTEARRLLEKGVTPPFLVVAHAQTAGKGRLGRSFHSPAHRGLYMTAVYRIMGGIAEGERITPAAAVAVAEAIERIYRKQPGIKWVNDLYLQNKKVCGILTEAVATQGGYDFLIGIGVNVISGDFPERMRHPAGAILNIGEGDAQLSRLCACITDCLFEALSPSRTADCLAAYRQRLLLVGRRVLCSRNFAVDGTPDDTYSIEGTVEGVDDRYGLILRRDNGLIEVLRGGEISVKIR